MLSTIFSGEEMQEGQVYTFLETEKLVSDFEYILKKYEINIESGSELERLCLNITDIVEQHVKPHLRNSKVDIRPYFRELIGLQDLMVKIVKSADNPKFSTILPYLKKLNVSSPLQNIKTSVLNQENNRIFELYTACLCLNLDIDEISIDNPDHPQGDNPDVIVKFNGKRWGLGCKVLHSSNPQTILQNLEKAVEQIEKSESEIGIPVINTKNIIEHDKLWPIINESDFANGEEPIFGAFLDRNKPISIIKNFVDDLYLDLIESISPTILQKLFIGKKSQPGCLVYSPTVTSVVQNGIPILHRLNILNLLPFDKITDECGFLLNQLNHQLQQATRIVDKLR